MGMCDIDVACIVIESILVVVFLWLWCKDEELLICMQHACMNAGLLLAAGVTQNATRVKGVTIYKEP